MQQGTPYLSTPNYYWVSVSVGGGGCIVGISVTVSCHILDLPLCRCIPLCKCLKRLAIELKATSSTCPST